MVTRPSTADRLDDIDRGISQLQQMVNAVEGARVRDVGQQADTALGLLQRLEAQSGHLQRLNDRMAQITAAFLKQRDDMQMVERALQMIARHLAIVLPKRTDDAGLPRADIEAALAQPDPDDAPLHGA